MNFLSYHTLLYHRAAAGLALGLLVFSAPILPAADAEKPAVIGRVGDLQITFDDVRAALAGFKPQEQSRITRDAELLGKVVRTFLVQRVVLADARAKNWDQSPGVQAQLERVRESALTESYLQAISQPPEDYPGEAELQSAYESAKPSLLVPRSYHLAQIFIVAPKNGDDAALKKVQARLDDVHQKLLAPNAEFSAVAKTNSDDLQSALQGGDIGWLAETQIQPEIRAKLPKLALNVLSDPVQLNDGWHILKVLDAREPRTPTLEQVRTQLREQLRTERTRVNTQAFLAKLMESHPVALNEVALSRALASAQGQ